MTVDNLYKGDSFFEDVEWKVVEFTFNVTGSSNVTSDVFNPNTTSTFNTRAPALGGLWITGGLANYNTFIRSLFSEPKMVRRISITSDTDSYLSAPFRLLTIDANGNSVTRPKLVGTFISPYQYQEQSNVDFKPGELLLDNNNYISQYTFLGATSVKWTIYYVEMKRSSWLARPYDTIMNRVLSDMGVQSITASEKYVEADIARQVFSKGLEPVRIEMLD